MGQCQHAPVPAGEQQMEPEPFEPEPVDNSDYIVLAQWQRDESNGSNRPNGLHFGKQDDAKYQETHQILRKAIQTSKVEQLQRTQFHQQLNNVVPHQQQVSQIQPVNQSMVNQSNVAPLGVSNIYHTYSKYERKPLVYQGEDIQQRPVNLNSKRAIF